MITLNDITIIVAAVYNPLQTCHPIRFKVAT